jgi:putative transposase
MHGQAGIGRFCIASLRVHLQNACAMTEYAEAKRALERLHRELMKLNPSAARSLEEGMEETLTVHCLRCQPHFVALWPAAM